MSVEGLLVGRGLELGEEGEGVDCFETLFERWFLEVLEPGHDRDTAGLGRQVTSVRVEYSLFVHVLAESPVSDQVDAPGLVAMFLGQG